MRHSNSQVLFQLMTIQYSQCNPRVAVQLSHHGLLLPNHDETLKELLFSMVFKYELQGRHYQNVVNCFKNTVFVDSNKTRVFYEQFLDTLVMHKDVKYLPSLRVDSTGYTHIYSILKENQLFQSNETSRHLSMQKPEDLLASLTHFDQDRNYSKILRFIYLQNNDFALSAPLMHNYTQKLLSLWPLLHKSAKA